MYLRRRMRRGRAVTAGLVLTFALTGCVASNAGQSSVGERHTAALAVCHDAITQQLKAPNPAAVTFSREESQQTTYGFKLTGVVDASGAGTDYVCSADQNGDTWVAAKVVLG
jgi:hypothetical protein